MRVGTGWIVPLVLVLIGVVFLTWLVRRAEPSLAFFPLKGEDDTPERLGIAFQAHTVPTEDGEQIRLWHLQRPDARAQVVYFHGNGGNLSLWSDILVGLWQQRLDLIAIDYRGYGLSTGAPSEQGLYRDVAATLRFTRERLRRPELPLIYWGRSLGGSMAAYAASTAPADGVVLEASFPSAREVFETNPLMWGLSWLASYRFPTTEWMATVREPVLVLHATDDSIVPYRLGQRLHAALPGPKTFVTIEGGDHNDPVPRTPEVYWQAVDTFIANLSRTRASPPPSRPGP